MEARMEGMREVAGRAKPERLWVHWQVDEAARVRIRTEPVARPVLMRRVSCIFARSGLEVSWEETSTVSLNHQI